MFNLIVWWCQPDVDGYEGSYKEFEGSTQIVCVHVRANFFSLTFTTLERYFYSVLIIWSSFCIQGSQAGHSMGDVYVN
jgi:hypothetical protein